MSWLDLHLQTLTALKLTDNSLTAVGVVRVLAGHVVDLEVLAHPHLECSDGQLLLLTYTHNIVSSVAWLSAVQL